MYHWFVMILLQKFLTNWRAQRGNFLTISLIFHDFSQETLCVDKIISQPRGILCVDKIGSPDRGILCVDKILSRPREILCVHKIGSWPPEILCVEKITSPPGLPPSKSLFAIQPMIAFPIVNPRKCYILRSFCSFTLWKSTNDRFSNKEWDFA